MKRSTKILVTTAAVIGIGAGSVSLVSAHGGFGGPGGCGGGYGMPQQWSQGHGPMMQRGFKRGFGSGMEQFMQERLDQAKYKLRITETQEPAWQEFTAQIGKNAAAMRNRMQQRWAQPTVGERVQHMRDKAGQVSQMANAVEKLYQSLTPEQQKIADQLSPMRMRGF